MSITVSAIKSAKHIIVYKLIEMRILQPLFEIGLDQAEDGPGESFLEKILDSEWAERFIQNLLFFALRNSTVPQGRPPASDKSKDAIAEVISTFNEFKEALWPGFKALNSSNLALSNIIAELAPKICLDLKLHCRRMPETLRTKLSKLSIDCDGLPEMDQDDTDAGGDAGAADVGKDVDDDDALKRSKKIIFKLAAKQRSSYGGVIKELFIGNRDAIKEARNKQQTTYGKRTTNMAERQVAHPHIYGQLELARYLSRRIIVFRERHNASLAASEGQRVRELLAKPLHDPHYERHVLYDILSKAFDKELTIIYVDGSPSEQKRREHRRRNVTLKRALVKLQTKVSGSTRSTKQIFRTRKNNYRLPRGSLDQDILPVLIEKSWRIHLCPYQADTCLSRVCQDALDPDSVIVVTSDSDLIVCEEIRHIMMPVGKTRELQLFDRTRLLDRLDLTSEQHLLLVCIVTSNDYAKNLPYFGLLRSCDIIRDFDLTSLGPLGGSGDNDHRAEALMPFIQNYLDEVGRQLGKRKKRSTQQTSTRHKQQEIIHIVPEYYRHAVTAFDERMETPLQEHLEPDDGSPHSYDIITMILQELYSRKSQQQQPQQSRNDTHIFTQHLPSERVPIELSSTKDMLMDTDTNIESALPSTSMQHNSKKISVCTRKRKSSLRHKQRRKDRSYTLKMYRVSLNSYFSWHSSQSILDEFGVSSVEEIDVWGIDPGEANTAAFCGIVRACLTSIDTNAALQDDPGGRSQSNFPASSNRILPPALEVKNLVVNRQSLFQPEYAAAAGHVVVLVDEFLTSSVCPTWLETGDASRLAESTIRSCVCLECGRWIHRDLVGAHNIAAAGEVWIWTLTRTLPLSRKIPAGQSGGATLHS
ncbi:hypothetical protein KI688_011646 [Linnemannia hyalina]|uniref:Cas12f1-like TNB domain-containing protein n=1 Tax=Linnemannia hyalina TaxID=64524 RepID=A0A9P7XY67_9FUNG|nr:hypothetical protein KI688_011646 [Linnemannia hyalina]